MKYFWSFLFITLSFSTLSAQKHPPLRANLFEIFNDSVQKNALNNNLENYLIIEKAFKKRDYVPIFNSILIKEYLVFLKSTEAWGFPLDKYAYTSLDSLYKEKTSSCRLALELLACESYLKLYQDISLGILKTEEERGKYFHFKNNEIDLFEQLINLANTRSLDYLKLEEPNASSYYQLKDLLETYFYSDIEENPQTITLQDSLFIGFTSNEIISLRSRLYFFGDLPNKNRALKNVFDKQVLVALLSFQKRNSINPDGQLNAATLKALNQTKQELITQLQLNLERWRWLPNFMPNYYAFANLPAFEVRLVKDDSLLLAQNMVCGKVGRNTPAFMDTMTYIDVNPTWTVPPTILQNDILPAAKRSSSYLTKKNIKVLNVTTGKYVSASSVNWANAKNYKFIQGPGLSNSLGIVKFIFPNDYYIFFHDTPHKEHFELSSRAYSSGCVRLSQPLAFAEALLHYNATPYSRADLDELVASQKTKRILLDEQPVVFIHYLTQEFKEGVLYTYPDVYGYNANLALNFYKGLK
jgi:murein L,D-transpeptidase YcbB/YkuD